MRDEERSRPRYEEIGEGYAEVRRADPRIEARLHAAIGDGRSVVNVGAGAGSYEPADRHVLAVEPSSKMASQRPSELAPAIRADAERLPFHDRSVDAAMAVLSVHHWDRDRERGVKEMRRIARGPVVILTFDPSVSGQMWLVRDYLPEVAELDRAIFPTPEQLAEWLGGTTTVDVVPIAADTTDWTLGSYWAHPERVLDERARSATSGFSRMPRPVVDRVVESVAHDLETGEWDARNGDLRGLDVYDAGLRLVVSV